MKIKKERLGRLQEWILVEAYKNGLMPRAQDDNNPKIDPREVGDYFVNKHDIYRNYFRLQPSPLGYRPGQEKAFSGYWELRLNSAVILSRSIKRLLKRTLIYFPDYISLKERVSSYLWAYANYIYLTESGIQKAKALLMAGHESNCRDSGEKPPTEQRSAA